MTRSVNLSLLPRLCAAAMWVAFCAGAQTNKPPELPSPAATLTELQECITSIVEKPKFASALWGIKIVSLDSGETLFERNAEKLFTPASNSKLYSVALALARLGSDYRIRTSAYGTARPDASGTLTGDLLIYGRGDPCINSRLNAGDVFAAVEPLARALTNAGLRRITGDLVGDYSYFRGSEYGSGWMCDDPQYYYGAEISALTINDNILQASVKPGETVGSPCRVKLSPVTDYVTISNLTVTAEKGARRDITVYRPLGGNLVYLSGKMPEDDSGSVEEVTVHNPAGLFVTLLAESLLRHGVELKGKVRTLGWLERGPNPLPCEKMVELASMDSLPISRLAREVLKPSQNLYTDLLLAHVGEKTRTAETDISRTSEELGILALNKFIAEAGIPRGSVFFEEGSGLSRDNLATPSATVQLLRYMHKSACADAFVEALPVAGVDGTLRNRMKTTAAAGNVRAKTGTLRWAHSLSGHVETAAGERLVFSLMLNRYWNVERSATRGELDAIAVLLANFTGRTY